MYHISRILETTTELLPPAACWTRPESYMTNVSEIHYLCIISHAFWRPALSSYLLQPAGLGLDLQLLLSAAQLLLQLSAPVLLFRQALLQLHVLSQHLLLGLLHLLQAETAFSQNLLLKQFVCKIFA